MANNPKPQVDTDFIKVAKRAAEGAAVLRSESDRGCVLVAASMLDATIESLLRSFFLDEKKVVNGLLGQGRPLATFSSRVDTCRAVGVISQDMYSDLHIVRKIRNGAAHFDASNPSGHEFSFSDHSVSDRCRALASCPQDMRVRLPPRTIFELFVGLSSAIFAEYARNSGIAKDCGAHAIGRKMLLELLPTVDFRVHLRKCMDQPGAEGK
jgi:DNA-binding MltR family transcriptional regulator